MIHRNFIFIKIEQGKNNKIYTFLIETYFIINFGGHILNNLVTFSIETFEYGIR